MTDGLRLTYYADDDGERFGRLEVEVRHDGFAGVAGCYFRRDELMKFAAELGAYPLPDAAPRLLGAYDDAQDEVAILLSASQINPRGQVGIEIRLCHPDMDGPDVREVRLTMPTTYARLDAFHREWQAVLSTDSPETVELGAESI